MLNSRSSCFVKEKITPESIVHKLKAGLVAGGNQQDKSIYTLDETSSPTITSASVFVTVSIAAQESRHVISLDVETAYLNAKSIDDKSVFMKFRPLITAILVELDSSIERYQDEKDAVIVKLEKSLYRCIESAVLWYEDLREIIEADEYHANHYVLCVFKISKEDR